MNNIRAMRSRGITRRISDYSAILLISGVRTWRPRSPGVGRASSGRRRAILQLAPHRGRSAVARCTCDAGREGSVRSAKWGLPTGLLWYVICCYRTLSDRRGALHAIYSTFAAIPLFFVWCLRGVAGLFGAE